MSCCYEHMLQNAMGCRRRCCTLLHQQTIVGQWEQKTEEATAGTHLKCTEVCTMLFAVGRGRKANGSALRHPSSSGAAAAAVPLACGAAAGFCAFGALTWND